MPAELQAQYALFFNDPIAIKSSSAEKAAYDQQFAELNANANAFWLSELQKAQGNATTWAAVTEQLSKWNVAAPDLAKWNTTDKLTRGLWMAGLMKATGMEGVAFPFDIINAASADEGLIMPSNTGAGGLLEGFNTSLQGSKYSTVSGFGGVDISYGWSVRTSGIFLRGDNAISSFAYPGRDMNVAQVRSWVVMDTAGQAHLYFALLPISQISLEGGGQQIFGQNIATTYNANLGEVMTKPVKFTIFVNNQAVKVMFIDGGNLSVVDQYFELCESLGCQVYLGPFGSLAGVESVGGIQLLFPAGTDLSSISSP